MSFNLEHFYNKTILVVGGGTSTLDVKWEDTDWDYLWTCNDFFKEERVLNQKVSLYMLGHQTDVSNSILEAKLRHDRPFTFYEPVYYRGKQNTREFKEFQESIGYPAYSMDIPYNDSAYSVAQKAGATFRLIQLALLTNASYINFVGFDGFNKEFSNVHAFSKHKGLKDTDTRRDWKTGYFDVFTEAYKYLAAMKDSSRLQNLGEGLDYNLGTKVSQKFFPLKRNI